MTLNQSLTTKITESYSAIISDFAPIEFGNKTELLDAIYAYRILLGRMPNEEEINNLCQGAGTWREFLSGMLTSKEYGTRLDFLPAGLELMSESNGFRFWFDTVDREMGAKIAVGHYEPEVTRLFKKLLKPGMYCLDIGAQTGYYTLLMAQCVGEEGTVLSYEPMEKSFRFLVKNIAENKFEKIVSTANVACAHVTGLLSVAVASNMIVADAGGELQIECVALDDQVNGHIHICKIDVEGHEPQVLSGMQKILSESRPIIITEMNAYWLSKAGSSISEYAAKLDAFGYELFDIDRALSPLDRRDGDLLLNTNVIAIPSESHVLQELA